MNNNPYQLYNEPPKDNRNPAYNQPQTYQPQGQQPQIPYQLQRYQQHNQPQFKPPARQPQYNLYQPVTQVIVIADSPMRCPYCQYNGPLYLQTKYTAYTWIWCLCLLLFCFILAWIPLCSNSCQDKLYKCKNCNAVMQIRPGKCC